MDSDIPFAKVLEYVKDAVIITNSDGVIVYWNKAAEEMFGYKKSEAINRKHWELIVPEEYVKAKIEGFKKFKETGKGFVIGKTLELKGRRKDGSIFPVELSVSSIEVNNERYAIAIIRDITEKVALREAIRESEEKFRKLSEHSSVGVYMIQDYKLIYANPKFAEISGYDRKELIGKSVYSLTHPDDRKLVKKNIESRIRGDVDFVKYRFRLLRKDGGVRIVEAYGTRIDYKGKPAIVGTLIDVTEEMKAKEKLEMYRRFYENAEDMFFILDERGRFVDVNPRYAEMLGCSKEELIGINAKSFIDPNELEIVKKNFERVMRGERVRYKAKAIAKNGKSYTMEVTLWPRFESGKIVGAEGILRDITQRERLEKMLKESLELFSTLAEKSPIGIYLVKEGRFVYVNQNLEKITGYSKEELLSMDPLSLIHPDYRDLVRDRYLRRERGEDVPEKYEFKIVTKNGEERWLELFATRITIEGEPAVLGSFVDITDRKKIEERQRILNKLLLASSEIYQLIIQKPSYYSLLNNLYQKFAEYGGYKAVVVDAKGECIGFEDKVKNCEILMEIILKWEKTIKDCSELRCPKCIFQPKVFKKLFFLSFPLIYGERRYGMLILITHREVSDDEINLIDEIARNVSLALRQIEAEIEMEVALTQIKSNLKHFEFLSDKLRNPLAVILGFLELRNEVEDYEKLFKILESQAKRIGKILEELREEESKTYLIERVFAE